MAKMRHWARNTASSFSEVRAAPMRKMLMLMKPHMTMLQVIRPTCANLRWSRGQSATWRINRAACAQELQTSVQACYAAYA